MKRAASSGDAARVAHGALGGVLNLMSVGA